MEITAKSKTFLIGEYCVLYGGQAIVLATHPEFRLTIKKKTDGQLAISGIDEKSPAFLFFLQHIDVFKNLSIDFIDPHHKAGGLGASSAQFTTLYKAYLSLTDQKFDVKTFLNEYKLLPCHNYAATPPSGADCIAQHMNAITYFDSRDCNAHTLEWNFHGVDFEIFRTGIKVATHTHLGQIKKPPEIETLNKYVDGAKKSFSTNNASTLCENIQLFFESLKNFGLVETKSIEIVNVFLKLDGVMAAKGCGAMGADTIIVIFDINHRKSIIDKAKRMNLTILLKRPTP